MIRLDAGNVRLTPAHRRQLMGWLRRVVRLGRGLGDLVVRISLHRVGRFVEARATVHDRIGDFACHARRAVDVRDVFRELARALAVRLHDQRLVVAGAA